MFLTHSFGATSMAMILVEASFISPLDSSDHHSSPLLCLLLSNPFSTTLPEGSFKIINQIVPLLDFHAFSDFALRGKTVKLPTWPISPGAI